jgi:lysophospholipase L1-like esterase
LLIADYPINRQSAFSNQQFRISPWGVVVTIRDWLAFAIGCLLLAVLTELAARWWIRYRRQYFVLPPGLRLRLEPDRDTLPQLEPSVRFDVNADGERGDDVPRTNGRLFRVLVAGGSQPEGYLLDQDTAWPGALQRLLERPEHLETLAADRVHVGNIARSGVGARALDLILDRVLPRYPRLQTIIILVGASDVLQWLERDAPAQEPPALKTSDVFRCHPERVFGRHPNDFAIVEMLRRSRQRWLRPVQVHTGACKWIGKARHMRAQAREIRTEMPDPTAMLAQFERYFHTAITKAKAHADRVIVVRQPWFDKRCTAEEDALMWHGGVGQAWREQVTIYYSCEVLSRLMALLDARAARVAHELRVQQVDLMPVLDPSVRTYYDFFHATPAGARIITSTIASAVLCEPHNPAAMLAASAAAERDELLSQKVS